MKQSRAVESGVVLFTILILLASSSLAQTNSWTNPASGYWEDSSWSLGQLPGPNQTILFTNAGWKALEIRPNTVANFPQTLTVDSIIISSPTNSLNTLFLNSADVYSPLIVNSLTLNENSALTMRSSALIVQSNASIGGTFNQNDFSGVNAGTMQIGDVGDATYTMSNGTLTVTSLEVLGGWGHTALFDQEGGYHLAAALWISAGGGEYDLNGGQLGGDVLMKGGTLIQSGGDLDVPDFSVDGFYTLNGGTAEAPGGFTVDNGSVTQTGGTNSAGPVFIGSPDPEYPDGSLAPIYSGHGNYTPFGGVLNASSLTIKYLGGLDIIGGTINIAGQLSMPGDHIPPAPGIYVSGSMNVNGGTVSAASVNSDGYMTQSAGTFQVAGDFTLFFYPAEYLLSGGLLSTSNTLVGPAGITIWQTGGQHIVQHLLRLQTPPGYPYGYQMSGGQLVAPYIEVTGSAFTHASGDVSNSTALTLHGGIWTENTPGAQLGSLRLAADAVYGGSSTLSLTNGPCVIHFLGSSSEVWSNNAALQIDNWNGSPNGGGQSQIIFGTDSNGLTSAQLSQIQFALSNGNYPAKILSSGEIVPVYPLSQTTTTLARQTSGAMQLNLSGPLNRSFEIDISTDLMNWTPWQTQLNSTGTISLTDDTATNCPTRYYRTILLP